MRRKTGGRQMKIVIVSGYFNPLHGGHLDMIESAAEMGDRLLVIVNNDKQQLLKKGKIILDERNRLRLMRALRQVDEVVLSIDEEPPVINTLEMIAKQHPGDELIFANGGDRSTGKVVPETEVCEKYGIQMIFDAGGIDKSDSSTRINQETGHES
jgi:glycerol-3-phosphate cytidylyltransferase/D-beta-D-heptose 7-phosphate kinase/D-beta-D-heptose 1-phosphate adenosyltransferase